MQLVEMDHLVSTSDGKRGGSLEQHGKANPLAWQEFHAIRKIARVPARENLRVSAAKLRTRPLA